VLRRASIGEASNSSKSALCPEGTPFELKFGRVESPGERKVLARVIIWFCVSVAVRDDLLGGGRPGSTDRGNIERVRVEKARPKRGVEEAFGAW
jgi:hypothetical protein